MIYVTFKLLKARAGVLSASKEKFKCMHAKLFGLFSLKANSLMKPHLQQRKIIKPRWVHAKTIIHRLLPEKVEEITCELATKKSRERCVPYERSKTITH